MRPNRALRRDGPVDDAVLVLVSGCSLACDRNAQAWRGLPTVGAQPGQSNDLAAIAKADAAGLN